MRWWTLALGGCGIGGTDEAEEPEGPTFVPLSVWSGATAPDMAGSSLAWWNDGAEPPVLAVGYPGTGNWEDAGGAGVYLVPADAPTGPLADVSLTTLYRPATPDFTYTSYVNPQFGNRLVAADDIDGDGTADLVVLESAGLGHLFAGPAATAQDASGTFDLGASRQDASPCGDVTGDGAADVCLSAGVIWGPVDPLNPSPRTTWTPIAGDTRVGGSDMDGDGVRELIVWDVSGGAIHRVAGPSAVDLDPALIAATTWTHTRGQDVAATLVSGVDLDGDGDEEVVLACSAGSTYRLVVIDDPVGGSVPCTPAQVPFQTSGAATGDFDGDGELDLALGGGPSNEVWVVLGPLSSRILTPESVDIVIGTEVPDAKLGSALAAADVDGDGRAELAVGDPGAPRPDRLPANDLDELWGAVTLYTLPEP